MLVTNLRDEDDDTLGPAMAQLGRRHAVTLASLKEPLLDELAAAPIDDFDAALTRAAALEYAHARRRQAAMLRHGGVAHRGRESARTAGGLDQPLLAAQARRQPLSRYWENRR